MSLDERVNYLKMKEKYKNKLKPWYKKWWGIIFIIIIILLVAAIIASTTYVVKQVKQIRNGQSELTNNQELTKITAAIDGNGEHYSLGPVNAPIQIMVFSDYACPYCKESMSVIYNLAKKYPSEIRITMRDYSALSSNSINLALAAHCAGEQNNFWQMNDKLFENQDKLLTTNANSINSELKKIASSIDLDQETFASCLDEKKYLYRLNDDFNDAEFLGVSGTPTWFINRYKITGLYAEENFSNLIEGLLTQ